ncbi:MAG: hypothetical protein EP350_06530 [Alphaproteobacteria bacterium]|nr:MAG: hypothetical protein EP350_06530 [Alphaproteobacteria bacterium]
MSQSLLELLVHEDPIPTLLGDPIGWQRSYGRTDHRGNATLLYERISGANEIAALTIGDDQAQQLARLVESAVDGWRNDPTLPQMRNIASKRPGLIPVRYRPGKRLTFRLGMPRELYCKALADDRGEAIVRDARQLWAASKRGELDFGVARPAGWLPGQRIIAMHAIKARSIADVIFGAEGVDLAKRMGVANASLAASSLRPAARYDYGWQMARSHKYARRIAKRLPESAKYLPELTSNLESITPGSADRPIHGAPHLHQWLINDSGLHLVDFDRFGWGDPELDAATFYAEMEFEGDRRAREIADAYLEGFAADWPVNPRLFQAYQLHKHLAKALRLLCSIRLDAAERCLEVLQAAAVQSRELV